MVAEKKTMFKMLTIDRPKHSFSLHQYMTLFSVCFSGKVHLAITNYASNETGALHTQHKTKLKVQRQIQKYAPDSTTHFYIDTRLSTSAMILECNGF